MGIGNLTGPAAVRGKLLTHYPSWGSETRRARGCDRGGRDLITPHGDRKPSADAGIAAGERGSLPLMGIGNGHGGSNARTFVDGLITPHGDRKPRRMSPPISRIPRSLPLMGIGNCTGDRRGSRGGAPHYPSWGSETSRRHSASHPARELITPHGDRKRALAEALEASVERSLPLMGIGNSVQSASYPANSTVSLPLMGIGNPTARPPSPSTARAHYPSWGSETIVIHAPGGDADDSLPLMGIGNNPWSNRTGNPLISLPLMGIGNPPPRRSSRAPTPPHYPSWGSETDRLAGGPGLAVELITPHGDRKRADVCRFARHHSFSLPLMGIGNRHRLDAPEAAAVHLITPHGDRKPAGTSARQPPASAHYPSWGSETSSFPLAGAVAHVSLPLMGIGNGVSP